MLIDFRIRYSDLLSLSGLAHRLEVQVLHRPRTECDPRALDSALSMAALTRVCFNSTANCTNSYTGNLMHNALLTGFIQVLKYFS